MASNFTGTMKQTATLGIDPSSRKLAMVVWDGHEWGECRTVALQRGPSGPWRAFYAVRSSVRRLSTQVQPGGITVLVEAPVLVHGAIQSMLVQAYVNGAIQAAVSPTITVTIVSPSKWKKDVVGHGGAAKSDIKRWLEANHPREHERCGGDQDLIDAHCIALYGEILRGQPKPVA